MGQGKRGLSFENMIIATNKTYDLKGWALIEKSPTPWKVFYDKKSKRVNKAFPERKGMPDYIGISHGRSICFDAKSTQERTRFPLQNIEDHQLMFLVKHKFQGGISFFLVEFAKFGEVYLLTIEDAVKWWNDSLEGGRKSIPYQWFVLNCDLVKSGRGVALDYLSHCS